jgi:hypothetical protein
VKKGAMPLSSYTLLHRGAALSAADVTSLCTWSEQARKELRQAQLAVQLASYRCPLSMLIRPGESGRSGGLELFDETPC